MKLDILFRSCSKVHCFTGPERITGPDVSKGELIERSLESLVKAIHHSKTRTENDISLTVIDDHSDKETLARMRQLLNLRLTSPWTIMGIESSGNGESMKANYQFARDKCDEYVLFIEDDYICHPKMIDEMLAFLPKAEETFGKRVVLHPTDDPWRYREAYPSYILLGKSVHWRQIRKTTCTFLLHKETLLEHWDKYMAITQYGKDPTVWEENTINRVYETIPCFSPIPSLALHLQYEHTLSPFEDWWSWYYDETFRRK